MNVLEKCRHALKDGVGRNDVRLFELIEWPQIKGAAVAAEKLGRRVYLLIAGDREKTMDADEYLDAARQISARFKAFVVPTQKVGAATYWGGTAADAVQVYPFTVLNPSPPGHVPSVGAFD